MRKASPFLIETKYPARNRILLLAGELDAVVESSRQLLFGFNFLQVSSDILRNFLNSLIGTLATVLGTPKEEELVSGSSGSRRSEKQRLQNRTKSEPKKKPERQRLPPSPHLPLPRHPPIREVENSLGRMISDDLREINASRRRFWISLQNSRRDALPQGGKPA